MRPAALFLAIGIAQEGSGCLSPSGLWAPAACVQAARPEVACGRPAVQMRILSHRQGTSGRCAWTAQRPRQHFCGKGLPSWKRGWSGSSSPKRTWSKRQATERAHACVNVHVGMQEERRTRRQPARGLPTTAGLLPLASRLDLAGAKPESAGPPEVLIRCKVPGGFGSHTAAPKLLIRARDHTAGSFRGFPSSPAVGAAGGVWHP